MEEVAVLCRTLTGGEELGGRECVEFHHNIYQMHVRQEGIIQRRKRCSRLLALLDEDELCQQSNIN